MSVHYIWCTIKIIHHTTLYLHGACKAKHKKEWISRSNPQTEILKFSDYEESQEKMKPHYAIRLKQSLLWTQVTDSQQLCKSSKTILMKILLNQVPKEHQNTKAKLVNHKLNSTYSKDMKQ